MALQINWKPVAERSGPHEIGYEVANDRLWIAGNPVVYGTENTLLLRFTTPELLADLLNAVVNHYGRWITSTVITKEGKGKQVVPLEIGAAATWFDESWILVTLGASSLKAGLRETPVR